jgi:TorA maturation chaperone TorD
MGVFISELDNPNYVASRIVWYNIGMREVGKMNEKETETHRRRQQAYLALAKAFLLQPSVEMLDDLRIASVFDVYPVAFQSRLEIGLAGKLAQELPSLELDYAQLFVGPGEVLAPPWESVYCTEEHLVFGRTTLDVRAFYQKNGLSVPKMNQEPDDHFGLELGFMSVLAERTADAYAGKTLGADANKLVQEQQRFLQEHLGQWTEEFMGRVKQFAKTSFYRDLAIITGGFIQRDMTWLQEDSGCSQLV